MIAKSILIVVLFIWELEAGLQPFEPVLHRDRRSSSYVYNSRTGSCYKFYRQGQTWSKAYRTCRSEDAVLAVVDTEVEEVVLQNIFSQNPSSTIDGNSQRNTAFVGIRDRLDGDLWKTIYGKSIAETAFRWSSGEPNNVRGNEYCGAFGRNGRLFDEPCNIRLPYICEKKNCG